MTRVLAVSRSRDVMGTEHSLLNVTPLLSSHGVEMMLAAAGSGSFEQRWRDLNLPFYELELPERQGFPAQHRQWLQQPVRACPAPGTYRCGHHPDRQAGQTEPGGRSPFELPDHSHGLRDRRPGHARDIGP